MVPKTPENATIDKPHRRPLNARLEKASEEIFSIICQNRTGCFAQSDDAGGRVEKTRCWASERSTGHINAIGSKSLEHQKPHGFAS